MLVKDNKGKPIRPGIKLSLSATSISLGQINKSAFSLRHPTSPPPLASHQPASQPSNSARREVKAKPVLFGLAASGWESGDENTH